MNLKRASEIIVSARREGSIGLDDSREILAKMGKDAEFLPRLARSFGTSEEKMYREVIKLAARAQVRSSAYGRYVTDMEAVRSRAGR